MPMSGSPLRLPKAAAAFSLIRDATAEQADIVDERRPRFPTP